MSDAEQQTQVFIELDSPARLIHRTTSEPGISALTTTVLIINKADWPMSLMSVYKFPPKARWRIVVSKRSALHFLLSVIHDFKLPGKYFYGVIAKSADFANVRY